MEQEEKPILKNVKNLSLNIAGKVGEQKQSVDTQNPVTQKKDHGDVSSPQKQVMENTLKLSLNKDSAANENIIKPETKVSNLNDLEKTIKLRKEILSASSDNSYNDNTAQNINKNNLNSLRPSVFETIKLVTNKVNTASVSKITNNNLSINKNDIGTSEEKSVVSELAKTLKLKFKEDSGSNNNVKKVTEDLKNTLKIKQEGLKTDNENLSNLANTLKIKNSIGKPDEQKLSTESNILSTEKPKVNEADIEDDASLLTNTLKLKKGFLGNSGKNGKENIVSNITATKDVSSSKIIKLRPSVKGSEEKIDPLKTQTIKIKIAKTDNTVKIPIDKLNMQSESDVEVLVKNDPAITRKLSLTKNLSLINDNVLKEETEEESKGSGETAVEENSSSKDDVVIIEEDEEENDITDNSSSSNNTISSNTIEKTIKLKRPDFDSPKPKEEGSSIPDLGDLKNVLDDLKRSKQEKIEKKVKKTDNDKETSVIIEEESTVSIFSLILCTATLAGIAVAIYFSITSFLTI